MNMRPPQDPGLVALVADLPDNMVMVEVGCYAGESTEIFASKASRIFAVDAWTNYIVQAPEFDDGHTIIMDMTGVEERFNQVCAKYQNITKLRGNSIDMAATVPDASVDFVYIDADHERTRVMQDIKTWLPKIKPDGIIAGHDYNIAGVNQAVHETVGYPHRMYADYSWAKRLPGGDEYNQIVADLRKISITVSDTPRIRLLEFSNQYQYGGTDKNAQTYLKYFDRSRFEVFAAAWVGGERQQGIEKTGAEMFINQDKGKMIEWIRSKRIDVAHFYRTGNDPLIIEVLTAAKVPVLVEHNCFGSFDPSPDRNKINKIIVCSKSSLGLYKKNAGALYDPKKVVDLYCGTETKLIAYHCRNRDFSRPIFGRHSRKDMAKWHPINILSLPLIRKAVPDAQFHVIGIPDDYIRLAQYFGVSDMIKVIPAPQDDAGILDFLNEITVFAHSAILGESFGNAIAEAMSSGLPVVTHTTDRQIGDNAQCEIVVHDRTGYVVDIGRGSLNSVLSQCGPFANQMYWTDGRNITAYADSVIKLLTNPQLKIDMGRSGQVMAFEQFDAKVITGKMEEIFIEELTNVKR